MSDRSTDPLPIPSRRLLRRAAGLTQEQVAERCGTTVRAVRRWERGDYEPGGGNRAAYLALLDEIEVGLGQRARFVLEQDHTRWHTGAAWREAIDGFVAWSRASGTSPHTLRVRVSYLRRLAEEHPDPWAVTTMDLARFLSDDQWQPATRKNGRGALRAFYKWAAVMEFVAKDPARPLPAVRVDGGVPRPLPDPVLRSALARATPRERLMVIFGAFCGLRRAEIAQVHTGDVVDGILFVRGKGRKLRTIPLPAQLLELVEAQPPGYLFPGPTDGHLSADYVGRVLKRLLGPGWSAHKLRHRFASAAYLATRDLFAVQKLLGHSKPETTAVYTQVPEEFLRAAVAGAAVGLDDFLAIGAAQ